MAEDRARQKRKRRKAQNVLPVNTKAKDTFFKKVCESEERLPEKVRYDIRLSESYLPAGEKYGENPPEPDLDATAHVYDFRMSLDETLHYIECGEQPARFAVYDSDMRDYALVANGSHLHAEDGERPEIYAAAEHPDSGGIPAADAGEGDICGSVVRQGGMRYDNGAVFKR